MGNYYQRAIDIFNDQNRYYDYFYSKPSNENGTYQLKIYELIPRQNDGLMYIRRDDLKSFDFVTNHIGDTLNLGYDTGLEVYNKDMIQVLKYIIMKKDLQNIVYY